MRQRWGPQKSLSPSSGTSSGPRSSHRHRGLTAEQKLFPLKTGDGLLLTVGEFVLASGDKIFGKGVTPDIKIDLDKNSRQDYLDKSKGFFPGS